MTEGTGRDAARRIGELEGEAFNRALASREERERQERLSALVLGGESPLLDPVAMSPSSKPGALEEAERRVEELAAFQRALFASKGWRAVQALRRLTGRSW